MKRMTVNQRANKEMKQYCQDHGIYGCELKLEGCMKSMWLTFAHKHKRRWYYDKPTSWLWKRSEWRLSCQSCHAKIEFDRELTEKVFGVRV